MIEVKHEPERGLLEWVVYEDGLAYDLFASEEEAQKVKGYLELKDELNEAIIEVVGQVLEDRDVTDGFIKFFEEYTGHDLKDWW